MHRHRKDNPGLDQLVSDMWETMKNANGCGLVAPQIGLPIRLFVVDSKTFENLEEPDRQIYFALDDKGITETFINAKIIDRSEQLWEDEEGCLSIPDLSQNVKRHWTIDTAIHNIAEVNAQLCAAVNFCAKFGCGILLPLRNT